MILNTVFFLVVWWGALFVLGAFSFPIVFLFFKPFRDRGWAFQRSVGILIVSYLAWIFASIRLVPFALWSVWLYVLFLGIISFLITLRNRTLFLQFLRRSWRLIVFEEFLFLIILVIWSCIRAYQPDIYGLEKFMDFGFINSILRSDFFPPKDIWLSGETINYYYFGHLVAAVLTKLSGLSSIITYNLMIATIAALSFVQAFSLGMTILTLFIKKHLRFLPYVAGLVSALILVFAGNLHTVYTRLTQPNTTYWYPDATRYIPYTIHEFPLYSFVVADLHGHVSDIPFVLLTLALLISLFRLIEHQHEKEKKTQLALTIFLGLVIGVMYMTNALDGPIYFGLSCLYLISLFIQRRLLDAFTICIMVGGTLILSSLIFTLPFHFSFTPFAKGVDLVQTRSTLQQLFILWGFYLLVGLSFIYHFLMQKREVSSFIKVSPHYFRTLLTIVLAFVLVAIPEFIYIKDIYIADYHRANTMFKLVYQTFVMMAVLTGPVIGLTIYSLVMKPRQILSYIFPVLLIAGCISVLIYPYYAIPSYYNKFQAFAGLDGTAWLFSKYPDDYLAISWMNKNITGQPVVAEAVGESYTDFARVSAYTGLPTILGWRVHEWLWRGSFDIPGKRTKDVSTLYSTTDQQLVCSLIDEYNISYIFVGSLERQQYENLTEEVFRSIGEVVFSSGNTRVYRIDRCEFNSST